MKKDLIIAAMAVALFGCSGSKLPHAHDAETDDSSALTLTSGKWRLLDFAGDGEMVSTDSLGDYYLSFMPADSTFGMTTDCNSIGGMYKESEDSLTFDNLASTQMACPSEQVQMGMAKILPVITTYAITPDSVLQLRSDMRTMARFALDQGE